MRTRSFSIAVLAVGALAVAGCGDDNSSDNSGGSSSSSKKSTPAAPAGGGTVDLSATEFKFDPANPSAKKGTVTFKVTNDGQTVHALEVEGPGEEQKTGSIQPGKSATLKVDLSKDGTYEFYCPIDGHRQQGMEGKVKVGSGGGSSSSSGSKDDSGGGGSGY